MILLDLTAMAPLIMLSITVLFLLLQISFSRSHGVSLAITLIGLGAAFADCTWLLANEPRRIGLLLGMMPFSYFYIAVLCVAAFIVALLAYDYFADRIETPEEFYVLLLLGTIGCAILVCSTNFVSLFLGLEILSVSLYAMLAFTVERGRCLEAGIKYLILAGVSSAFLVFGVALIYAHVGTLEFAALGRLYVRGGSTVALIGFGMLLVAAGFKLALVPFHFWTPDVYEGAPAPATAFLATASKGAMIGVMLRIVYEMDLPLRGAVYVAIAVIAIASMLVGNLLALLQTNVKRILAYSSISHLGYILVAFAATAGMASPAATYYIVAYMATALGAFGVISVLSTPEREAEELADFHSLAWRRPGLAAVMCFMLLSLAGIPLTAGFIGKFYLVAAGANSSLWTMLVVLAVSSVIGLFYYLRVILVMFAAESDARMGAPGQMLLNRRGITAGAGMALVALLLLVLWLGVLPSPVLLVLQNLINPFR